MSQICILKVLCYRGKLSWEIVGGELEDGGMKRWAEREFDALTSCYMEEV
jgi:hypothetical protein